MDGSELRLKVNLNPVRKIFEGGLEIPDTEMASVGLIQNTYYVPGTNLST